MRILIFALVGLFSPFAAMAQEVVQDTVRPRAVSVQSVALQEVGPWGAAALPEGMLPLTSDLWRGADPATLGILFARVSPDQRFPSLQALTRQAIFSGGAAPTTDPTVTRGRFEAANRFGPAEAAARLIFGVPRLATDTELAGIAIDAGLRVGRTTEACSLIEAVSAPLTGTTWLEARAACYALNDEAAAANLSIDLAKARGLTDTWLSRAIAAVAGPLTAPPPFRVDSGRAIALSLRGKLKPPMTLASTQDPIALSALLGSSEFMATLPPEERLGLARNGANRGVISLAALVSFQPATLPDEAVALPPIPAQISQKLLASQSLALRAIEGRSALAELKSVMATQPGLMTLSDVPVLTEAALWAGDGALAASIAALSPSALDPRLALVLALYDSGNQTQAISQRLDAAPVDPVARRIALRDAVVAWSSGLPANSGLSLLVQTGLPWGPAGNAGLRTALDLAASRGSKGEVILLTALATQGLEPNAIDPETLIAAIKALRRVGLTDGARDLARDYLLATYVTLPARPVTRARSAASSPPSPLPIPAPRMAVPPARQNAASNAASLPNQRPQTSPRPTQRPVARAVPANPPPAPTPSRSKPSWGTP
jgi:hypothetical protein